MTSSRSTSGSSDAPVSVVVGDGSLAAHCTMLLARRGHRVAGVLTREPRLLAWAGRERVPVLGDVAEVGACDYLFSIVNPHVLPAALLALPRRLAINYHDAPLPRYAGLHATTWAILGGETEHGITWHAMTERVDAGDILRQARIPIAPDETALSLDFKCFGTAYKEFEALLAELAAGTVERRAQDLSQRTYFGKRALPQGGWPLHCTRDAAELDRQVRALTVGPAASPVGRATLLVRGTAVEVRALAIAEGPSGRAPGTVTRVEPGWIHVATGTDDVRIGGLPDGLVQVGDVVGA